MGGANLAKADELSERLLVLVVDDETLVRKLAVQIFEQLGCEVFEAADAASALAILEMHPDIELMFTDCRMPGGSGQELAMAAAAKWPRLRVVLTTAYHDLRMPDFPIVRKPYAMRTIERVIDGTI